MYMWVRQYPVTDACEEAEVTQHTAIDVYQWPTHHLRRPAISADRQKSLSAQTKSLEWGEPALVKEL